MTYAHLMRLSFISPLVTLLAFSQGFAAQLPPKKASLQIERAVKAFSPIAESGIEEFNVEEGQTIREALLELAFTTENISEKSEFEWVGYSSDAWGADTMSWGAANMKQAYAYITNPDEQRMEFLNQPGQEKEKAKYLANIRKAKEAFKLLLNTGVMFGVAPMGAVQCGVTFAALVIYDPHTGDIYVIKKEGSGC